MSPPSQEGVQTVQVIIPRQAVLAPNQEGVQMLLPSQAMLTLSPEGVQGMQALIPR